MIKNIDKQTMEALEYKFYQAANMCSQCDEIFIESGCWKLCTQDLTKSFFYAYLKQNTENTSKNFNQVNQFYKISMHKNTTITVIVTVLLVNMLKQTQTTQITPSLQVLQFLILDEKNCYKLQDFSFEISSLLQDPEFVSFAREDNMQNLKSRFQQKIDAQIQQELEKVKKYYEQVKEKLVKDFENYQEDMKQQVTQQVIQEFSKDFFEGIKTKDKPFDLEKLDRDIQFLKINGNLEELKQQVFKNGQNDKYSKEFYLYGHDLKGKIIKSIFEGDTEEQIVNKNWQQDKNQYTNSSEFINKSFKASKNNDEDYLKFVDYYILNNKSKELLEDGEYLLLDQSYLNFKEFDILFANYEDRDFEFYQVVYDVLIQYRIANINKQISLQEFLEYFDKHISQKDKQLYYATKILMYFKLQQNKMNVEQNFAKDMPSEPQPVIRLIEDRDDVRKFAVQINKQFQLHLKINSFENLIDKKSEEQLEQAVDQFFKTQILQKSQDVYQNEEVFEYIEQMNQSENVEVQKRRRTIVQSIMKYSLQEYVDASSNEHENWNKHKILIEQILRNNKEVSNLQFLEIILKELSDSQNDYVLQLQNIKKFFSHKYFKTLVIEKTKTFQSNVESQEYCTELQMDLDLFETQLIACPQIQDKVKRQFSDDYLLNFIKLMSFIRIFDYYNDENNHIVYYFVQMYKFIVLSKHKYTFDKQESLTLSMSRNLDLYLQNKKSNKSLLEGSSAYFSEIDTVHDILKILNLRNYFVKQNQHLLEKAEFPYTVFGKLATLLYFQSDSKIKNQFLQLLEQIRSRFSEKHEFYAFNLLYLIIRSNEIIQSPLDQNEKYTKILSITKSINNFESNSLDTFYLRTSRDLALFYYLEYLNFLNHTENKETIKQIFVEDVKRLTFNEKLYLFCNKILNLMNSSFDYANIASKKFDSNILESNSFQNLIAKKFNLFQKIDSYNHTLSKTLSAYEYMIILIDNQNIDQIEQEGLIEEIQHNIVELFNLQQNKQKQPLVRFKEMANTWLQQDNIHSENVFLFNYYLLARFFSKDRYSLQNQQNQSISQKAHNFLNVYFHQKIQGSALYQEDKFINSENLYFISQLIFTYSFVGANFVTNNDIKRNELNMKTAALWLHFNSEGYQQIKQLKDENFINALQQLSHVIPQITSNNSISHKHLNFIEETFRGIFEDRCRFEQFDFILNHCDFKENEYILLQTIKQCNDEKNVPILNNYIYQMLKAIYDSLRSRFYEINSSYNVHQNLLENLKNTSLVKLDSKQVFINFRRIFTTNYQLNYSKGFAEFLQALWTNFDYDQVQKLINSKEITIQIQNDHKKEFENLLMLDTLIFAQIDEKLNYDNMMLQKQDLLSLMLQKLKYTNFLTRIFTQGNYNQKENIEKYFSIYSAISKIRIENIDNDILDKEKVDDLKVKFLDIQHIFDPKQIENRRVNTTSFFANIFFTFYVEELIKGFDSLTGRAYKCKLIEIIQSLMGEDKLHILTNIDKNEASQYLNINGEVKNNFDFFYKEVQRIQKYKQLPGQNKCVSNENEIMRDYLEFYKSINKGEINVTANRFEYGIKEETTRVDRETEFMYKKNLFI